MEQDSEVIRETRKLEFGKESKGRHSLMVVDIWSNYCPTVCNHLRSRDQFLVHSLLHRNITDHTTALHCNGLK
jgi:hypothetical protein